MIKDQAGRVYGALETLEDITERMLAEDIYITLANNSPVGFFVAQDGKFVFTNSQFQKSTGYSADERAQALVDQGLADPQRVGIVGWSYGGYMTLTLAGRHPELWKAAVDMFGPYNLTTFIQRLPDKQGAHCNRSGASTQWLDSDVDMNSVKRGLFRIGAALEHCSNPSNRGQQPNSFQTTRQ